MTYLRFAMNKRKLYYFLQFGGWGLYLFIAAFYAIIGGQKITIEGMVTVLPVLILGISISHLYREMIIYLGWLKMSITPLIPRILLATIFYSVLLEVVYQVVLWLLLGGPLNLDWKNSSVNILGWSSLFFIWSLIYFAFHFFQNYRKEEIKNLQWEATNREFELNRLKSQLNPHFIFNAMNTIRALVDEDPGKAKKSITRLSNVLRNSLMTGKKKVISLEEELSLVRDYLEIEAARYEERLAIEWEVNPSANRASVPPLMIQTLVENGIKHGISTLPEGGTISIRCSTKEDRLQVAIANSGTYHENKKEDAGFGIFNTRQRLHLLYGDDGHFHIDNKDGRVITELDIPLNPQIK